MSKAALPRPSPITPTYIALLRGINVGGKNSLPMSALAAMFTAAGALNVRTYIQSGNVVFAASPALAGKIPRLIRDAITKRCGFDVPVVLRSADEWADAVKRNPFKEEDIKVDSKADGPVALHVAFLETAPTAAQLASLDPNRSPPDRFIIIGREIYLLCPNGLGKSKLTNAYFDSKLKTVSTMRNWNTALTLMRMSESL